MSENLQVLEELRQALCKRREVIADRSHYQQDPAGHLDRLKEASLQITELSGKLPDGMDAQFRHFLDRCSYDKALAWIDGRGN